MAGTSSAIVEAVRKVRREIDRECDNDLRKLLDFLKRGEKESSRRIGTPPRRGVCATGTSDLPCYRAATFVPPASHTTRKPTFQTGWYVR
jgi:hypothetical protein